jgi:hypothetical protein
MRKLILACVLVAACGGQKDAGPVDAGNDAGGGVACSGATASLTNDVTPIFVRSCSGGEICHGAFGGTSSAIHDQLVNRPAFRDAFNGCDPGMLVVPGDVGNSYLVKKLTGVGMCAGTAVMPLGGMLATAEIQKIADWICGGAQQN